jgi:hypothetical protein
MIQVDTDYLGGGIDKILGTQENCALIIYINLSHLVEGKPRKVIVSGKLL